MVQSWAAALSKHAAQSQGARMSTGVLSACGRIAPLCPRAGVRRMLRRSVHAARTNKARLGTRRGSHALPRGPARPLETLAGDELGSRSRARALDLGLLAAGACGRGSGGVGTGDFPHRAGCAELKQKLVPAEPGLYRLRGDIEQAIAQTLPPPCRAPVRFMLEVEISTIYKK